MKELEIAELAARKATVYLLGLATKVINSSEGKDIKLQADVESEQIIIDVLQAHFDYPILTEEAGELKNFTMEGFYWIIDPIDGTLNFSRGVPLSCISIALYHKQKPVLGVVFDFNRDEMFTAIIGEGAWLNHKPIKVSSTFYRADAIIATGFPSLRSYDKASLDTFVAFIQDFKKVRLFGSAALSLAYVACGRVDAYHEAGIRFWDVAAGLVLVQSAGGFVQSADTCEPYTLNVLCSSTKNLFH